MLTRTSATELGKYNIRVNGVRPSGMQTELHREFLNYKSSAEKNAQVLSRAALKENLEPSHVANLVYFLSSSQSAMITGEDVAVDAGIGIA